MTLFLCIVLPVFWGGQTIDPNYNILLLTEQEKSNVPVEYCVETNWSEMIEFIFND